MNRHIAPFALLLLLVACGGGGKDDSTTDTAQGTAKVWLQAALTGNDARCVELSTDDFKEKSASYTAQIRERITPDTKVLWGGSGKTGADYEWTAAAGANVVFFKVREASTNQFRVSDVQLSW